jgi:hypothetical protein
MDTDKASMANLYGHDSYLSHGDGTEVSRARRCLRVPPWERCASQSLSRYSAPARLVAQRRKGRESLMCSTRVRVTLVYE